MAGKGGHAEVGQHFSRTSFLVLVPGDEHNKVQHKHRNEAEKWEWTVGENQDPQSSSDPFPGRSERTDCA